MASTATSTTAAIAPANATALAGSISSEPIARPGRSQRRRGRRQLHARLELRSQQSGPRAKSQPIGSAGRPAIRPTSTPCRRSLATRTSATSSPVSTMPPWLASSSTTKRALPGQRQSRSRRNCSSQAKASSDGREIRRKALGACPPGRGGGVILAIFQGAFFSVSHFIIKQHEATNSVDIFRRISSILWLQTPKNRPRDKRAPDPRGTRSLVQGGGRKRRLPVQLELQSLAGADKTELRMTDRWERLGRALRNDRFGGGGRSGAEARIFASAGSGA